MRRSHASTGCLPWKSDDRPAHRRSRARHAGSAVITTAATLASNAHHSLGKGRSAASGDGEDTEISSSVVKQELTNTDLMETATASHRLQAGATHKGAYVSTGEPRHTQSGLNTLAPHADSRVMRGELPPRISAPWSRFSRCYRHAY